MFLWGNKKISENDHLTFHLSDSGSSLPKQSQKSQHAHNFHLGVQVFPGTDIWGYKLKFEGTTLEVSNWCSYFDGISPHLWKFIISVLLEILDPQSFPLPDFYVHLLESAI